MLTTVRSILRGFLVIGALALNAIVWFVPLFLLAILKLLIPFRNFRRPVTRYLLIFGENRVSGNTMLLGLRVGKLLDVRGIDGLNRQGWFLLVSKHQSWVDILAFQSAFNRRIPFLTFFNKTGAGLDSLSGDCVVGTRHALHEAVFKVVSGTASA